MTDNRDDLKWFGEGFDGFPKSLPEDCVDYTIYIIDTKLKDLELRNQLREVQKGAEKLTRDLLKEYIWQRDPFRLSFERDSERSCLHGRTNYGDSVDDEWLIVYILRELSREFSETWTRVADTDGQFLLIEAANALPVWLNPELADFRVWINDGRLLIIPLDEPGGKSRQKNVALDHISLGGALEWIANPDRKLQHSMKIETEAFFRLGRYPQQIKDSLYHACVTVPRYIAYLLHSKASFISPAIEAFYLRDSIALRTLRKTIEGGKSFTPGELVTMSVTFTKVGYAQLRGQQFAAPHRWATIINNAENERARTWAENGMKITCGFEMLLTDSMNQDKQAVREMKLLIEDLEAGVAAIPSNEEVRGWGLRDDDESWLDIDFNEFEKKLAGKPTLNRERDNAGFGDRAAQENLQKIVERFQGLLQDDSIGPDGEGLIDDMDNDDDDSDDGSRTSNDDYENKVVRDEFTKMMRQLMDMPPEVMKEVMTNANITAEGSNIENVRAAPSQANVTGGSSEDEEEGIREAMRQTEQELRKAGVLDFEPQTKHDIKATRFDAIQSETSHG